MNKTSKLIAATLIAFTIPLSITACGTGEPTISNAEQRQVVKESTIIDVRTPAEYGEGHLENALNIDFKGDEALLKAQLEALDKKANYIIYCNTGNRSAQAAAKMKDLGFTKVTDAGALDKASETTGIKIVQ